MKILDPIIESLFNITSSEQFEEKALELFWFHYEHNSVYRKFVDLIKLDSSKVTSLEQIPYLPISFFKSHKLNVKQSHEIVFKSSGTTGQSRSRHLVADLALYEQSFELGFRHAYGDPRDYTLLALLPSYLEQGESSLVYMAQSLIQKSGKDQSSFYLNDFEKLNATIHDLEKSEEPYILLGVSYALLDFFEEFPQKITTGIVMETGGMKGRRKEMTKTELHRELRAGSGATNIHSEYGMTELLSQAYSKGDELYHCPPWMKVTTRSTTDPLSLVSNQRGLINVIDLANIYSCPFLSTEDLGYVYPDGSFEVLGRFDTSEMRGCNLLVE